MADVPPIDWSVNRSSRLADGARKKARLRPRMAVGALYPFRMDLSILARMEVTMALSALQKGGALLVFTGVAAPLIGLLLKRVAGGWETLGGGPFAILDERPQKRSGRGEAPSVDPAVQAAEVRQMLEAKAERRRQRGEAPLDVEAEAARLLAAAEQPRGEEAMDAELRAEVRQLVLVRNERRLRAGLEPLDVEAETDRQLADLIGSG